MSKNKAAPITASMITPVQAAGLVRKGEATSAETYVSPLGSSAIPSRPAALPVGASMAQAARVESAGAVWPPVAGATMVVKISACHDNKYNARRKYHSSVIKDRAASIAADGQKVPAAACAHPERPGEFILIDGGYRKRALQNLGRDEIIIRIEDVKNDRDLYRLSRMYNKERSDGSALDDALAWQKLLDDGVATDQNDLAVLAGVDKSVVSKILSLLKLPEVAIEQLMDEPAGIGHAIGYELYLLSKVAPLEDLMKAIDKVHSGEGVTVLELAALRRRFDQPSRPRKQKEMSRVYRISREGAQVGFLKDWDNGKVAFEVTMDDPRKRAELVEEIKRKFGVETVEQEVGGAS